MKTYAVTISFAFVFWFTAVATVSAVSSKHEAKMEGFHVGKLKSMNRFQPVGLSSTSRKFKKCSLNICFAFDGSRSISRKAFDNQKLCTTKFAGVVKFGSTPSKLSAVQYATIVKRIQRPTRNDELFIKKINRMKQMKGERNIASGIIGCRFLLDSARRQARHMIIMTNGAKPFSSTAMAEAKEFRRTGGLVTIVTVGNRDASVVKKLKASFGKIYNARNFAEELEILKISRALGKRVCSKK